MSVPFYSLALQAEKEIPAARDYFPRGLVQPEGSFRFSLDALLLASFPVLRNNDARLLDLGTGCGVVALGLLCRYPHLRAVGLDLEPCLLEAALCNAALLGFAENFTTVRADVTADPPEAAGPAESFDLVLANPPYRQPGKGRLPANPLRRTALFADSATLAAFCRTAAYFLAPAGRFGIIFPAPRLADLRQALFRAGLWPVRGFRVHSRAREHASLVLVEARRCSELPVQPDALSLETFSPLVLYRGRGKDSSLGEEALAFCPWLSCNRERAGR